MNNLINFQYGKRPVRTLLRNNEPWFVAKDACDILGYRMASDATRLLDDDEKGTHTISTLGGPQEMIIINEPGLYTLIFGSRKPEAKAFKRWVTHEVLPAIRKTGSYLATPATDPVIVELSKRLTLAEIVTLFEVRMASEGGNRSGERIEILAQGPQTTRRRHSKVDRNGIGKEVQQMIRDGHMYKEIAEAMQNRGICISRSSINRYGQRYLKTLNRNEIVTPSGLQLVQELGKAVCH